MGIPPTIEVANLGMTDTLILMVMALVVFGPRRLPQIGRQIGKLMYEFRKASNDFKFQMEEELRNAEEADRRKKEEEERQRQLAANPPAQLEASTPVVTEPPASTESTYPPGDTYGEVAEAQAQVDAASPSIQPPSTGEIVPAEPPASGVPTEQDAGKPPDLYATGPEVAETAPETPAVPAEVEKQVPVQKENEVIETALEDTSETQEPAAHNG